jgi:hypothetical protein
MIGVLPWLVRWVCHAVTRDFCPALAALYIVGPEQNIFFLSVHFFNLLSPGQAVVLGRLSLSICVW